MKTLLLFLFPILLSAQPGPSLKKQVAAIQGTYKIDETGSPYYERIIESDKTKADLHKLALTFAQSSFLANENEIRSNTPDEILCVGVFHDVGYFTEGFDTYKMDMFYTLRIQFKENKARILLTFSDYRLRNIREVDDIKTIKVSEKAPISTYPYGVAPFSSAYLEGHEKAIKILNAAEASLKSAKTDW